MSNHLETTSNDFVFQIIGGQRNGEEISVGTAKCLFGSYGSSTHGGPSTGAIFRGNEIAILKNYDPGILVNGEPKTTHRLNVGDEIEFPNSIVVKVQHIGCTPNEPVCGSVGNEDFSNEENEMNPMQNSTTSGSHETNDNSKFVLNSSPPEQFSDQRRRDTEELNSQKIDELESQITDLCRRSEGFDGRFEDLESRLSLLTDKISQLVDIVTATTSPVTGDPTNADGVAMIETPPTTPLEHHSLATDQNAESVEIDELAKPLESEACTDLLEEPESISKSEVSFESCNAVDAPISEPASMETKLPESAPFSESAELTNSQFALAEIDEFASESTGAEIVASSTDAITPSTGDNMIHPHERQSTALPESADPAPADQGSIETELSDRVNIELSEQDMPAENFKSPLGDEETPPTEQPRNESVADLLARMKAEGQWSGIPDDSDSEPSTADSQAIAVEPVVEDYSTTSIHQGNEEADVEDYMSQLLSRMRGGAPAPTAKQIEVKPESTPQPEPVKQTVVPLRPEEFVPKQKAAKIESLNAMRELANSTARSAVKSSELSRRKTLAYLQLGISIAALAMSVYYFSVQCKSLGDMGFLIGILCLGATGFLGYRFYTTMSLIKVDIANQARSKARKARANDQVPAEIQPQQEAGNA